MDFYYFQGVMQKCSNSLYNDSHRGTSLVPCLYRYLNHKWDQGVSRFIESPSKNGQFLQCRPPECCHFIFEQPLLTVYAAIPLQAITSEILIPWSGYKNGLSFTTIAFRSQSTHTKQWAGCQTKPGPK